MLFCFKYRASIDKDTLANKSLSDPLLRARLSKYRNHRFRITLVKDLEFEWLKTWEFITYVYCLVECFCKEMSLFKDWCLESQRRTEMKQNTKRPIKAVFLKKKKSFFRYLDNLLALKTYLNTQTKGNPWESFNIERLLCCYIYAFNTMLLR